MQTSPFIVVIYTGKDLKQITKMVLESQGPATILLAFNRTCKRLLKAKISDVY